MTAWISWALPRERLVAGIRRLWERQCWRRDEGEEGRELQDPKSGCLEEQLSLPQGQGQALPGDGKGDGLSPSLGKPVAGKPSHPAAAPHSHGCPRQVPATHLGRQPTPVPPGARAGTGEGGGWPPCREPQHPEPTLFAPSRRPHGPWRGDAAQAINIRAVRRTGGLCFSVRNSSQSRGTAERKHQGSFKERAMGTKAPCPMEQGKALWGFERTNKPAEQWVREKGADALSQGQKIGQEQGPCRMDVDVTEESPSPGDREQRGIFGVLTKKETENIRPHLATRPARGFGVGGDA